MELQSFINNSIDSNWDDYNNCEEGDFFCGSPNPYMDYNTELVIDGEYINSYSYLNNGTVDPLELGYQTWADGRLVSLLCGAYIYCGLSGEIPENINNLTEIEVLRLEVNYFDGEVPDSICELENVNFNDYLSFDLSYNYLCPPYPYCVPDNAVQYMDTFDCLENGDFNNDGSLDILDIIILVNNIINLENIDIDGADINNDQEVNILDVVLLVSIVLGT